MEVEAKREALLLAARSTRSKWIMEAKSTLLESESKSKNPEFTEGSHFDNATTKCIEGLLKLVADIIDDGLEVNFDAMCTNSKEDDFKSKSQLLQIEKDPFNIFLEKLRHPTAFEIVRSMQQFQLSFENLVRESKFQLGYRQREEDHISRTNMIWAFIENISAQIRNHPLWEDESEAEKDLLLLHCEKLVFHKLYSSTFGTDAEDTQLNNRMHTRLHALTFLNPEHLDIRSLGSLTSTQSIDQVLAPPTQELLRINNAKCPSDKILAIKRCSGAVAQILKEARRREGDQSSSMAGADEFLPLMILVVKSSNPSQLLSNVKYLQRYTHPSRLVSESGYLLTHFVSAVHFLEHADAQALTVSPEEFDRSLAKAQALTREGIDRSVRSFTSTNTAGCETRTPKSKVGESFVKDKLIANIEMKQKDLGSTSSSYLSSSPSPSPSTSIIYPLARPLCPSSAEEDIFHAIQEDQALLLITQRLKKCTNSSKPHALTSNQSTSSFTHLNRKRRTAREVYFDLCRRQSELLSPPMPLPHSPYPYFHGSKAQNSIFR